MPDIDCPGPRNARQKAAFRDLGTVWEDLSRDLALPPMLAARLPEGWGEIDAAQKPTREKVTLRLDRDVLRFYRGMGRPCYGERINQVLRAYMLSILSQVLVPPDLRLRADEEMDEEAEALLSLEATLMRELSAVRERRLSRTR